MKIGFIGMGNMAQALCEGFVKSGSASGAEISAYAPHRDKLEANAKRIGFKPAASAAEAVKDADLVFLACKPYQIEDVLTELGTALLGRALVSIAAGWTLQRFELFLDELTSRQPEKEAPLSDNVRIQCVMPNTPAMVSEGVFLIEQENTFTEAERDLLFRLLKPLGLTHELPSRLMGIGAAITGCSPAFVDLFLEAYADAAVKYGIPRADAYPLIAQAVRGSAALQQQTGTHPGVLKDQVCSPAGTTICGVQALEANGFRAACMASIDAIMQKK